MNALPSDWPLTLALAALLVAVALRVARPRGVFEWAGVAAFSATVIVLLAERLGLLDAGRRVPPAVTRGWAARIASDMLMVGGLLLLARTRGARRPDAPSGSGGGTASPVSVVLGAAALPMALLGYTLRDATLPGVVGVVACTGAFAAAALASARSRHGA